MKSRVTLLKWACENNSNNNNSSRKGGNGRWRWYINDVCRHRQRPSFWWRCRHYPGADLRLPVDLGRGGGGATSRSIMQSGRHRRLIARLTQSRGVQGGKERQWLHARPLDTDTKSPNRRNASASAAASAANQPSQRLASQIDWWENNDGKWLPLDRSFSVCAVCHCCWRLRRRHCLRTRGQTFSSIKLRTASSQMSANTNTAVTMRHFQHIHTRA